MADVQPVKYIWKNGEWCRGSSNDARFDHALHYGSGVFEGIRCYHNEETDEAVIFRLRDHMERLQRSSKIA